MNYGGTTVQDRIEPKGMALHNGKTKIEDLIVAFELYDTANYNLLKFDDFFKLEAGNL